MRNAQMTKTQLHRTAVIFGAIQSGLKGRNIARRSTIEICGCRIVGLKTAVPTHMFWHIKIAHGENEYRMKSVDTANSTTRLQPRNERQSSKVKMVLAVLTVDG